MNNNISQNTTESAPMEQKETEEAADKEKNDNTEDEDELNRLKAKMVTRTTKMKASFS